MNGFQVGDADGGLNWLPADGLPTDAAPAELFGPDATGLLLAGPQTEFEWAGEAK
ncbi:hypothetical protein [Lentzea sp. NPDC059081]|uniref:hypothetical protein n=1 Tax=Lentzea sp. NPDC059081 TaxID=3346719 RepID=UPI0036C0B2E5